MSHRFAPLFRVVCTAVLALAANGSADDLAAQTGRIGGQIVDAATGRPIASAEVRVEGPNLSVLTDIQGRYRTREIAAGSYAVVVSRLGYAETRSDGVVVEAGRTTTFSIALENSAIEIEGITISSERTGDVSSEAGLLRVRQAAPAVTDGISAEQIGRAPDSDAGDAIARITGVSVVDNSFVVVRGLAERYSNTLLNGAELSSPEPAKRVVPLDIFPASLIESLVTSKTATPDKPGDFAGGSVEIQTKEFPEERVFEISASQSWNSVSTFQEQAFYPRSTRDYFAFDGRSREIDGEPVLTEAFVESLRNEWTPSARTIVPDMGFGINLGDQVGEFDRALGYVLSVDYGAGTSYEPRDYFAFLGSENGDKAVESTRSSTTRTVDWGVVANLAKRLGGSHKISVKNLLTRDAEEYVSTGFELDPDTRSGFTNDLTNYQVRYLTRTFLQSQVGGTHRLLGTTFDWKGTYSRAFRDEPENRTLTYVQEEATGRRLPDASEANDFWFRFLDDQTAAAQVDWAVPLSLFREGDAQLKVGALARRKRREFDAALFNVRPPLSGAPDGINALALPPEALMSPENIGRNVEIANIAPAGLPYDADDDLSAAYAMADLSLLGRLRLVGGVRAEQWDLSLSPGGASSIQDDSERTTRSVVDILPSGNLTLTITDAVNLRLAYSQTVNRPDPRELSTSPYAAVSGECTTFGNPDLKRAKILNGDARLEWYPSPGELISVGGFYKQFDDPIVQAVRLASLACIFFPVNAESAENIGLEVELRKNLGLFGDFMRQVSLGGNFTFVEGDVTPGFELFGDLANLPLQDQSRRLANANLNFDSNGGGFSASVLANYFDDRVRRYGIFQAAAGEGGQSRSPDVFEQGRLTVDAKVRLSIGRMSLSVSGRNLTDEDPIEFQQTAVGDVVVGSSTAGTSVSISVSFSN